MKKLFFLPLFLLIGMAAAHVTQHAVDTASSNIVWKGSKVTGTHMGNVKVKSGSLTMDHGKLTGGSFDVDMNSITCTDLQGEWGDKLVAHLKNADFFGVDKYPTSKFVITRAIPLDTKGNYKIVGNMTIKEATKEVKFNANVGEEGGKYKATGTIKLDRSEFDIRYGSGSFFDNLGDKTIYDEFDLEFTLFAAK